MQNCPVWFVHFWKARRAQLLPFALLAFVPSICVAQEASPTPSPTEMEAEPIVVTATRFDIPLDLSPASASVITSEDLEQKQIERVSDALREVPGLSVVQTGTAGQLTSVFTRGLRSEHCPWRSCALFGKNLNNACKSSRSVQRALRSTHHFDPVDIVGGQICKIERAL